MALLKKQEQPIEEAKDIREMENKIAELEARNRELIGLHYVQSLADEKTFRMELLSALNEISTGLKVLTETVVELTGKPQEE